MGKDEHLEVNTECFLQNKDKLVLVQIGNNMFKLKYFEFVRTSELDSYLDKYDVRLLKEK